MTPFIVPAGGQAPDFAAFRTLAQTPAPAAPPTGTSAAPGAPAPSPLSSLIFPLILLGAFFLIFAPQMKRNKEHTKLLAELKPGDEIVTSSGILGTIAQVKPDRFVVEIAKGVRVEVRRTHVEARAPSADAATDKKA